jgi:hypothetical protein
MKNNTHMGDKNILFIEFLNKKHKLFKHEQQETHLDTKNEKTNRTKDYNIGKNAALRSKNKNWTSQNNVSEWNDISTHRLLFQ